MLLHLACCCLMNADATRPAEADLARLRLMVEQTRQSHCRFDVTYEVHWRHFGKLVQAHGRTRVDRVEAKPTIAKRLLIRHAMDGSQGRVEFLDLDTKEPVSVHVYDLGGRSQRLLLPLAGQGSISTPDLTYLASGTDYRVPWLNAYGRLPIARVLEERNDVSVRRERDGSLVAIAEPTQKDHVSLGSFGFALRFETKRGGACSRIEVVERGKAGAPPLPHSMNEVLEWHDVGEGRVVPVKTRTVEYWIDGYESKGVLNEYESVVDRAASTWGSPLRSGTLELAFPHGTLVEDQIRKVRYTVGQNAPQMHLDRLAAQSEEVRKADAASLLALPRSPIQSESLLANTPWWRTSPAYVAYGVLLVALAFLFYRRRQLAAE